MKKIIILLCLLSIGCSKDCPECFSYAEPFRLAILNEQNQNLLDPGLSNGMKIDKLTLASGELMEFTIKNYIIPSDPLGFFHLESIDDSYFNNCIDKEGEIYVTYSNSLDIDTINVLIEKLVVKDDDGCACVGYPYKYIKHNGVILNEYDIENKTGSAIIRK